jgi:hypothetical protein
VTERAGGKTLQRLRSVPTWFLRHHSNEENKQTAGNIFQFPDTKPAVPKAKPLPCKLVNSPPGEQNIEQITVDNHVTDSNHTKEE